MQTSKVSLLAKLQVSGEERSDDIRRGGKISDKEEKVEIKNKTTL